MGAGLGPQLCLDEKGFFGFQSGLTFGGVGQEQVERFLPRNRLARPLQAWDQSWDNAWGPLSANRKLIWARVGLLSVLLPSCLLY